MTSLFNGKDLSAWMPINGKGVVPWIVQDGYLEVKPGTGNILTREKFGDYQLHVEFWLPLMADKRSQERANSGVYQHGLYEIQVLDSYHNPTYRYGGCGAIYGQKDPDKDACKPPERWQTYDITFHAPRFGTMSPSLARAKTSTGSCTCLKWNCPRDLALNSG